MQQEKPVSQKMSALIAAAVVAGVLAAVATATVMTLNNDEEKPTLSFEGVTLQPVIVEEDGKSVETIQALVEVYAENVEYLGGVHFDLNYNSDYWAPSNINTNEEIKESGNSTDFYRVPQELYDGRNPYYPFTNQNKTLNRCANYIDVTKSEVQLLLVTQTVSLEDTDNWPVAGSVGRFFFAEDSGLEDEEEEEQKANLYIKASEKTHIVTLSFRVNPEKLPEMLQLFSGYSLEGGISRDNVKLLALKTSNDSPALPYWSDPTNVPMIKFYVGSNLSTMFVCNIPDRPVSLHSNEPDVTINAYQAYTGGTVADIVDAVQKYSPTARGVYSSGRIEDFLLHWGGGEGCYITDAGGTQRLFRWTTDADGNYDGGYELLKWDDENEAWAPDDGAWYDPTQGTYAVAQFVDYFSEENGVQSVQQYERPVSVTLNVTPVTVTDVTATDLYKTYTSDAAQTMDYDSLELPDEALLTTDVVCGSGNLMMNIDDWTPTYTDDMSTIQGARTETDNTTTTVTWNKEDNVGVYTFTATPVFTITAIQAAYPWLTVTRDYPLNAVRQIVAAEDFTDSALFEVRGYSNDASGVLTLVVFKRNADDAGYDSMVEGTTFRVKLPNGAVIAPDWFAGTDGSYPSPTLENVTMGNGEKVKGYIITINPGSSTGNCAEERELVRRSINLGGYFSVAVTEPKTVTGEDGVETQTYKAESDFIPAYVAPRRNVYLESYVDDNAFDFTGERSTLLPLYRNMQLATTVVLPYGSDYSVATRYNGVTGAEPGAMHTVVVDAWDTVSSSTGGTWDGSQWTGTAPITVEYGEDLFARSALITGYGQVVNPDEEGFNKQVAILTEVLDEDAPEEDIRLTYEETGASVSTLANGEVDQVTFDPRSVGYEDSQRVTLTLTNTGTTDIRGLYLDTSSASGAFRVIDPPATELPVGASTTFTLSYTLGLSAGIYYADTAAPLKVCSAAGELKEFRAYLKVTASDLWRVTVKSKDETMGTARLVIGVTDGVLNDAGGANIYEAKDTVWVLAEPKGEYAVAGAYYYDKKQKQNIELEEFTSVVTSDGKVLYSFAMPEQNVTVYVVFEEPVKAKLRLELLKVFAGPDDSTLTWQLPLRRADDYVIVQSKEEETPELTAPDYLVIIPAEDESTKLEVKLRDILTAEPKVFADVNIVLTYEGKGGTSVQVYDYTHSAEDAPKLDHSTAPFASPDPGHFALAEITISAYDGTTPVTRTYTVKIARRPNEENPAEYPLSPGNSPYGMIEGDAAITDKAAAKAAFDVADSFAVDHTPALASALTNTYWAEAWGDVNYDKDPSALFVYLGEPFDDAGPEEVLNTARDKIALENVTRTMEVTLLNEGGNTQADQFSGTTTVTLDLGTADVVTVNDWWKDAENDAENDYNIRPGVYAITYTFTDADGEKLHFQRPLIILSRNGDADLDGTVDADDAAMIEKRLSGSLGYQSSVFRDGNMFLYRVCDANNDRNLNNIDADAIRGGKCVIYYLPTGYSDVTAAAHDEP